MDEHAAILTTTRTKPAGAVPVTAGHGRSPPSALYEVDLASTGMLGWVATLDQAVALGFDGVLLKSPFATNGPAHRFNILDHDSLHESLGGGDAETILRQYAAAAHGRDLSFLLEICIDRIAPDAALAALHPDWFVHADDGAAFCFLSEVDPATEWWCERLAAWQDLGIDGFRCEAAHRVPATVWARLIAAARQTGPASCFVASTFGATPPDLVGLEHCGFDFALTSSCWWDGVAPWIVDDLDRIGMIAAVATLAVPPHHAGPVSGRALSLAGFLGNLWILNASAVGDRTELIGTINEVRRQNRACFATVAALVSPPESPVAVIARLDRTGAGLVFVMASGHRTVSVPQLRTWLGDRCGDLSAAMGAAPDQVAFEVDDEGTLLLHATSTRRILCPASARISGRIAMNAPRIAIEAVSPSIADGRFPIKRIVGDEVTVAADLICDGHGRLAADLLWRTADAADWHRVPMALTTNDRWAATLQLSRMGRYHAVIEAWIDRYGAFVDEISKKNAAGQPVSLELIEGTRLVEAAVAARASSETAALEALYERLTATPEASRLPILIDPATIALMRDAEQRHALLRLDPPLMIDAECTRAGFASWYELFPRSQSGTESRHGTFHDVIAQLPRIRAMGFDVLYFPPIHPIGEVNRKGRNNSLVANETDPGSPYAIGSVAGGHCAIHAELGGFDEFRQLLDAAAAHGIEIALDFAIQCAPDHPWLREHPEWFDWRPDGTIRYAENPPKKYEDIVNVDFYADGSMPSLWIALRDVVAFWVDHGVKIFRVDNPHTKPLPFWAWLIDDIRGHNPEVIFLAEAFTAPKLMYRLAKIGFSQSYTYFTWRNTAAELRDYLVELTTTGVREFFRPNFFVNTPDINPLFLQGSGRPGFLIRAALASTLSGLWGVYNGFELCEARALPGREEYLDSEKYQISVWDHNRSGNIIAEITALNCIRRQNPALHSHLGISFLPCSNEQVLCYEKSNADRSNVILVAVSLDPFTRQIAEFDLPLWRFGLSDDASLHAADLTRDVTFVWHGKRQSVSLDPHELPYCIWRVHP
ncbi:maltotransferase domain-containing protein [Acidiphilium sp.]|uniref:maltotransferase domain-containing protein n=1 Tax=Acidiphilium sp. TaxID=527 RepID=UPI003D0209C3